MSSLVMLSAAVLLGLLLPSSSAYNILYGGDTLSTGQSITHGAYTFIIQSDCNLVLYDNGRAVWSSGTYGRGRNCILSMQTDGNLVIYDGSKKAVWASNSRGSQANYILVLQRDRNVVIYGAPRWSTGTHTANSEGVVIVKSDQNDISFTPMTQDRKIAMVTNN
ncbi:hypothetical protein ZIOFF_066124 [Zingiber officinale]|uniref:Bulb-type lectin domain-containing protein n=2 Tax=Zingiber officinale TaxID=94328 RepID=A0A8J5EXV6_ZINOF|nr:hypothetical protein ZIOFF_066124 [Zingiber officinale]